MVYPIKNGAGKYFAQSMCYYKVVQGVGFHSMDVYLFVQVFLPLWLAARMLVSFFWVSLPVHWHLVRRERGFGCEPVVTILSSIES